MPRRRAGHSSAVSHSRLRMPSARTFSPSIRVGTYAPHVRRWQRGVPGRAGRHSPRRRGPLRVLLRGETVLALVWLVFAGLAAWRFPWHGLWHDDAIYMALGKALTTGEYVLTQLPGSPVETRYPPLHPAVLAVCWWLGGSAERPFVFALPGLVVVAIGIPAWGLLLQLRLRLRAGLRLSALALAVFAPGWLQVVHCAMAEPWVFGLLPIGLLVLGRAGGRRPAMAGAVFGLAALAKSIVLAPLVVVALQLAVGRHWRAAVRFTVAALVVVAPWWVHVAAHRPSGDSSILRYYQGYAALFCRDVATFCEVLPERVRDLSSATVRQVIGGVFTPEVWPEVPECVRTGVVIGTGCCAVALLLVIAWSARRGSLVFGAAGALCLVSLVVLDASWRHAMPVLPVTCALLLRCFGRRWPWAFGLFASLTMPAAMAALQFDPNGSARMWRENVSIVGYASAAAVVRDLPEDVVVASEVDSWLHLVTGRRAVMSTPMHLCTPCDRGSPEFDVLCRREWQALGVTHVLIDPHTGERERALILAAWRDGLLDFVDRGLPAGFVLLRRR